MTRALAVAALVGAVGCGPAAPVVDAAIGPDARRDAGVDAAIADDAGPDGAVVDAAMIDGAVVDAAVIDGAVVDGATIDGAVVDGAVTDGAVTDAATCVTRAFTLDGALDADVTVLGGGTRLRLAVSYSADGRLYVATDDAGEGSDHFILVSTTAPTGASRGAPFAKAGTVAAGTGALLFLADENDNDFSGWFERPTGAGDLARTGAAYGAATAGNGGVLEGTVDLAAAFGAVPTTVYLAAVPYQTGDGGALFSAAQTPAGDADGDVDGAEYVAFTVPCP